MWKLLHFVIGGLTDVRVIDCFEFANESPFRNEIFDKSILRLSVRIRIVIPPSVLESIFSASEISSMKCKGF
ncbi:hypothetical protein [Leptospira santarosai]|uniref:hypothetical protein n=1 Tax=Leptospira santarosai TaxID=28183 RepID=UPI000AA6E498|nr:hypothetical protein [Leptospira santarosai]MBW9231572.1 hypothetical protein [Leptospira santarosai]MDI7173650.1 hypothetical protein [Leptospira santarosai]MDI7193315.1 hypothetical protein [Leptospira santarosai]MDO6394481.1 hypothetical protein [Leptospira santarosai]MDO6397701.1 hypothetical protein [Leptospira santarosai]